MDGGCFYAVLAENDVEMRKWESRKMVLGGGGRTKRTLRTGWKAQMLTHKSLSLYLGEWGEDLKQMEQMEDRL